MRKILFITAVLVAVFAMAATSFAWGRGGYGCGYGYGPGYVQQTAYTPEQAQKVTALQQAIRPQQQQMFQLRNELWTLRNQQNPDWNAITAKQREMFELRTRIQKQAVESGVAGMGYGYGYGKRGRGMGRW